MALCDVSFKATALLLARTTSLPLAVASFSLGLPACDELKPANDAGSRPAANAPTTAGPKPKPKAKPLRKIIDEALADTRGSGDAPPERAPGPVRPGDIVAKVGDVALPKSAMSAVYDLKVKKYVDRGRETPPSVARRYRASVLRRITSQELLRQAAARKGVTYSHRELLALKSRARVGIADWPKHLVRRGESESSLRAIHVADLLERALLRNDSSLEVSEAEVKADYEANRADWNSQEGHFQTQQLLIADGSIEAEENAKKLHARASEPGTDLTKLAKDGAGLAAQLPGAKGDFFVPSKVATEIADAVKNAEVGTIAPLVKTNLGHYVIKVVAHWPPGAVPVEAAAPSIAKRLYQRKMHTARRSLRTDLMAATEVLYFMDLDSGELSETGTKPPPHKP